MDAGGSQNLPSHLPAGFHHYSGLYSDMYGHVHHSSRHHHHHHQQQQTAVVAQSRGFFTPPDLPPAGPISHHVHLPPRIDNSVLTYLNDVTAASATGNGP